MAIGYVLIYYIVTYSYPSHRMLDHNFDSMKYFIIICCILNYFHAAALQYYTFLNYHNKYKLLCFVIHNNHFVDLNIRKNIDIKICILIN